MTHFITGVVIPPARADQSDEAFIENALAPFDENREAERYALPAADGEALLGRMRNAMADGRWAPRDGMATIEDILKEWSGEDLDVTDSEHGDVIVTIYSTYNPDSKWDWWALGGRWDGAFGPNIATKAEAISILTSREEDPGTYIPSSFVIPGEQGPEWIEQHSWGWFGMHSESEEDNAWFDRVIAALTAIPDDHRVAWVDLHI